MSSLHAKRRLLGSGSRPPIATSVFYTLDGVERGTWVPSGSDRWSVVAEAVGRRRGCRAQAEEPPTYDAGTRTWTLMVTLLRRWRRARAVPVAVRWA